MTTLKLKNTNDMLKGLAVSNSLTRADLAILLHVSTHTVNKWYSKKGTNHYRVVPLSTLELLRMQLFVSKNVNKVSIVMYSPVSANVMTLAGLI